jgi:hypothetical protein
MLGRPMPDIDPPRRRLIVGTLAALAVVLTCPRAQATQKMSKQDAQYQDSPKDIRMCATCTLFELPTSCKVVEGDISPSGWCKAYAMAD